MKRVGTCPLIAAGSCLRSPPDCEDMPFRKLFLSLAVVAAAGGATSAGALSQSGPMHFGTEQVTLVAAARNGAIAVTNTSTQRALLFVSASSAPRETLVLREAGRPRFQRRVAGLADLPLGELQAGATRLFSLDGSAGLTWVAVASG